MKTSYIPAFQAFIIGYKNAQQQYSVIVQSIIHSRFFSQHRSPQENVLNSGPLEKGSEARKKQENMPGKSSKVDTPKYVGVDWPRNMTHCRVRSDLYSGKRWLGQQDHTVDITSSCSPVQ